MGDRLVGLRERVSALIELHGGLSNTSRELGIDKAYLHRLFSGAKSNPSPLILDKLGLNEKRVMYVLK